MFWEETGKIIKYIYYRVYNFKNVIFDTRSLFIQESISSGDIKYNSSAHLYWLNLEKMCLLNSYATCVSKGMIDYYCKIKKHPVGIRDAFMLSIFLLIIGYFSEAQVI